MIRKERLYLGWQWSQASGAVAGRCSGEAMRCRQARSGDEDDRGTPARLRRGLLLQKNDNNAICFKKKMTVMHLAGKINIEMTSVLGEINRHCM
jgi:hypothetical protein